MTTASNSGHTAERERSRTEPGAAAMAALWSGNGALTGSAAARCSSTCTGTVVANAGATSSASSTAKVGADSTSSYRDASAVRSSRSPTETGGGGTTTASSSGRTTGA